MIILIVMQSPPEQLLKAECLVLKEGLSEFSLWIRQKMQLMEEDMDIFKVVYSLHGSLSQVYSKLQLDVFFFTLTGN